jgi:uncharacterized protein YndB with AHSA1/START domain
MSKLRVERALDYPADTVWALIGDFGGLHRWHPLVQRLDLSWEGRIRTLHFHDGSRVVERLETRNDPAHRYVYAMVDGALPLHDCRAILQVQGRDGGCLVSWSAVFEPLGVTAQTARGQLRRLYTVGLATLSEALQPGGAEPS